jgi:hypothetical protein
VQALQDMQVSSIGEIIPINRPIIPCPPPRVDMLISAFYDIFHFREGVGLLPPGEGATMDLRILSSLSAHCSNPSAERRNQITGFVRTTSSDIDTVRDLRPAHTACSKRTHANLSLRISTRVGCVPRPLGFGCGGANSNSMSILYVLGKLCRLDIATATSFQTDLGVVVYEVDSIASPAHYACFG